MSGCVWLCVVVWEELGGRGGRRGDGDIACMVHMLRMPVKWARVASCAKCLHRACGQSPSCDQKGHTPGQGRTGDLQRVRLTS